MSKGRLFAVIICAIALVTSYVTPAHAAPDRYEAESATISRGAVEANHTGYSGTGFVNYDNVIGSYVEWTVTVPTAGWAELVFRFANGTGVNRPMDVSVNGEVIQEDVEFQPTGSWSTWFTYPVTPLLAAGVNKIRATATTSNGGPNLDAMDVQITAPTLDYQAEDATLSQGVAAANHSGYSGTGFVDYDRAAGSYVEWTVTSPRAERAITSVVWRYANGSTVDRLMVITVNDEVVYDMMNFPNTGGWDDWDIAGFSLWLQPGVNHIRATALTADGGPNVDKIVVNSLS